MSDLTDRLRCFDRQTCTEAAERIETLEAELAAMRAGGGPVAWAWNHSRAPENEAPQPSPTPQADSQPAPLREGEWINDAGRIKWLMWRVQDLEAKLAARAPADSVQEDAAREAIEKVLALFPFNALIQKFSVNNGPCLTADNDDEFYSVKRVLAFLTEIKTTLDAARKQGANHD